MICVCEHDLSVHRAGEEGCLEAGCRCPWFCTPEEADEIIDAAYERALADGEPWAEEAYECRHGRDV